MRARLLRGIGAALYGQGATALVQLVSVPLLIAAWGPSSFGTWTLLTAVPAALAFADGGLVLASGNAMAMLAARGEVTRAAALFRRTTRRVIGAVAGLGLLALGLIHLAPATLFAGGTGDPGMARILLDLLAGVTLLGVLGTLPAAALRASGDYALATAASTTARLAETVAIVGSALLGGSLVATALAWGVVRLGLTPLLFGLAHRRVPWLGHAAPDDTPLPALARPAAAALLLPACFALSLQGVTLVLGLSQPPAAVAAFVAARTLSRTLVQAVGLVIHPLMPEMSHAAGRNDLRAVADLERLGRVAAAALLLPGWLVLLVAGPAAFAAWTGGRLPLASGTLPLIATAAVLHGLWLSRANLLLAVNRQADYAGAFLLATLATAALAGVAAALAGLPGAAAATVAGEAVMLLFIAKLHRKPRAVPLAGALAL